MTFKTIHKAIDASLNALNRALMLREVISSEIVIVFFVSKSLTKMFYQIITHNFDLSYNLQKFSHSLLSLAKNEGKSDF